MHDQNRKKYANEQNHKPGKLKKVGQILGYDNDHQLDNLPLRHTFGGIPFPQGSTSDGSSVF